MGPDGGRIDPKTHQPLTFRLGIHSDDVTDSEIAPYLVEWLAAIGIKLNVQSMSFTQLNTVLPEGDWDILMDSWNVPTNDPAYLLSVQTCGTLPTSQSTPGNTDAFFCDPSYDKLYDQQFTDFSEPARAQTVDAMQNILYHANIDIILYYSDNLQAVRTSSVSGFCLGTHDTRRALPGAGRPHQLGPGQAGRGGRGRLQHRAVHRDPDRRGRDHRARGARRGAPPRHRRRAGVSASSRHFAVYLARKIGAAAVSFAVLLVVGFVIFSLIPANPLETLTRGRAVSAAQIAFLRQQLGLNQPVLRAVLELCLEHAARQPRLLVAVPGAGVDADRAAAVADAAADGQRHDDLDLAGHVARHPQRMASRQLLDRVASGVSLTFWSVPTFWLGLILLVAVRPWVFGPIPALFPAGGMSTPGTAGGLALSHIVDVARHLVLPCLTLVLVIFAQYVTIMRSSVIDELGSPYLLTARAKGLRDAQVRRDHAVPNALLPTVTVIFLQLGGLVSGAITVETVFSWPGLGYLTYQALEIPDLPLLEGTFIVFSASVIVMNMVADIVYRYLDPEGEAAMTAVVAGAPSRLEPRAPVRPRSSHDRRRRGRAGRSWSRSPSWRWPRRCSSTRSDRRWWTRPGRRWRRRAAQYPLGTDQPGRSVLMLLIWGTRPSLTIGVIATLVHGGSSAACSACWPATTAGWSGGC